jgi:hypothetical protein
VQLLDSPFVAWQLDQFTGPQLADPEWTDPAADPDGDGMNNFTEYALHKDPNLADVSPLFTQSLEPIGTGGDQLLVVTYQRRVQRVDVNYVLGVATELTAWDESPAGWEEISAAPDENGVTETVRVQILSPLSHFDRRFVRLRIIRP